MFYPLFYPLAVLRLKSYPHNTEEQLFAKFHNLETKEEEPEFDESWYDNRDAWALIDFVGHGGHISEVDDDLEDFGVLSPRNSNSPDDSLVTQPREIPVTNSFRILKSLLRKN